MWCFFPFQEKYTRELEVITATNIKKDGKSLGGLKRVVKEWTEGRLELLTLARFGILAVFFIFLFFV